MLNASKREARSKIRIPYRAWWKTTTSIGGRCKVGNSRSRAVLIRPLASLIWLARQATSTEAFAQVDKQGRLILTIHATFDRTVSFTI